MNLSDELKSLLDFEPQHILEAGVGPPEQCRSIPFWENSKCMLFEPLTPFFVKISQRAALYPDVKIFPVALWHTEGTVRFFRQQQSSYVDGVVPRTTLKSDQLISSQVCVPSAKLSRYDKGDFDLALIDVEAAEWFVLQEMASRPRLISLELWQPKGPKGSKFRHSHYQQIMDWMKQNSYEEAKRSGRDSYFRRKK